MSSESQFETLYRYHFQTTAQLMVFAAKLSSSDYFAHPGYGHGSIHDLLFHILRTDRSWRTALETGRQQAGIRPEDFPTLDSLKQGFIQEQTSWQNRIDQYSPAEINADITLFNWRDERWNVPLWRILQHVILHGMQHQTEIAQLLTAKAQSPGDIDFIFYQG